MSNFKKILDSFSVKKTLNPKIWKNPSDPEKSVMKPEVRKALTKIAEKFVEFMGDDVFVEDIVLTGSLANFNWSEYSDFDLHVIVDLQQYEEQAEIYKELFNLKKQVFNEKHDIKIYGYDVELYAQDQEESHYSSGVYSIMNDEWLNKPKKFEIDVDKKVLKDKIECWTTKIDNALETATLEDDLEVLDNIKEKIKDYRKSGLEKDGELSYENLVFKFLRRSGHIEKLYGMANKVLDKELSVENRLTESDLSKDEFNTVVNDSSFYSDLMKIITDKKNFKFSPGLKIISDDDVMTIQKGLEKLGFNLDIHGVDGKFGKETEDAIKDFQSKYELSPTGEIGEKDLKHLLVALVLKGFKDSDFGPGSSSSASGKYVPASTSDVEFVKTIVDRIEGGYYHPKMQDRNPKKFSAMGDSGETMFGIDRKHGASLERESPAAKEFWNLIDQQNASENWPYLYTADDNPTLKQKLIELSASFIGEWFRDLSDRYLSPKAREIVMSDPKLKMNFFYAAYNGSGFFQKWGKKFSDEVERGNSNIENLREFVLKLREEYPNFLIQRSGRKMRNIFDLMA